MKASHKRNLYVITVFFMAVFLLSIPVKNTLAAGELKVTDGFAHYKFNSVNASLSSPVTQTVSGATLHITADLKNNNDYPIVDGSLYIKVYKKHPRLFRKEKTIFRNCQTKTLPTMVIFWLISL